MASVQPTMMPNDIAERKTGRPRIYTPMKRSRNEGKCK